MTAISIKCNGKRGDIDMKRVPLQVRINAETKEAATLTCDELGLSISDAVNVFLTAFVRCGGFPFDVQTDRINNKHILSNGATFEEVMNKCNIKPEDLEGWEDIEIE